MKGTAPVPSNDPCTRTSEHGRPGSPGGGAVNRSRRADGVGGRTRRRELMPANVFFVRLNGRVAALLVGRNGQIRLQAGVRERWRLVQVSAAVQHRFGRITLCAAEGDPLTVSVYGQHEAGHLDLGNTRPRQAGIPWRTATRRARRQAADRLRAMLGR